MAAWYDPFSWFTKKQIIVPIAQEHSNIQEIVVYDKKPPSFKNKEKEIVSIPQKIPVNGLHRVISVTDGDTLKVSIDGKTETLRLIGIDTPETLDFRKPVQCFGKEASNKAKEILSGKNVKLESDPTQGERDKYNRLLRYVFLEDGTFYNKLMIADGYAHEYTYQSNPYKYQLDFKKAEKEAREQNKGLWGSGTCNGDTTQPVDSIKTVKNISNITIVQDTVNEPRVKKSNSSICHEKGVSVYYEKTNNFTSFSSIEDCLASGGRLPKQKL